MNGQVVVATIVVVLSALAAPLAVVVGNCMAMGSLCDDACSASACATMEVQVNEVWLVMADAPPPAVRQNVLAVLFALPDPPPRAAVLSV